MLCRNLRPLYLENSERNYHGSLIRICFWKAKFFPKRKIRNIKNITKRKPNCGTSIFHSTKTQRYSRWYIVQNANLMFFINHYAEILAELMKHKSARCVATAQWIPIQRTAELFVMVYVKNDVLMRESEI